MDLHPTDCAVVLHEVESLDTVLEDGELPDEEEEETSVKSTFKVDVSQIETVSIGDQASEIQSLGLTVYDQGTLERGILNQVEEESRRRDAHAQLAVVSAKLKLAEQELKKVESARGVKKSFLRDALTQQATRDNASSDILESHKALKEKEVVELRSRRACLREQLSNVSVTLSKDESEQERKVRMGEMTPFGTSLNSINSVENYLKSQKELHEKMMCGKTSTKHIKKQQVSKTKKNETDTGKLSASISKMTDDSALKKRILFPKKRRKKEYLGTDIGTVNNSKKAPPTASETCVINLEESGSEYVPSDLDHSDNDSDFLPSQEQSKFNPSSERGKSKEQCAKTFQMGSKRKAADRWAGGSIKQRKVKKNVISDDEVDNWKSDDSDWICTDDEYSSENDSPKKTKRNVKREIDDGNEEDFYRRVNQWERQFEGIRSQVEEECHEFDHGYKVPLMLWKKLYKYQQIGVRWLWELHVQRCGGVLGDEMGLGKTVQIIAFLAGLFISKLKCRATSYRGLGPTLIICPTTVMHQWVREFHTWFPPLRVAILHESGCYTGKRTQLIREIVKSKGIIITSYTAVTRLKDCMVNQNWHYVILDEGHKIRNPDAQVTLVVKQLRTPHRLILSGSPMQNNLRELWSLFDFVFPGKLGTLPVFMQEFAVPITQGGYSNASEVMVATAFKCATVLRDTISPYLLRRMKSDVSEHIKLPTKNEQVLFCRLTDEQRNLYRGYLECGEVGRILEGRMQIFVGLINLRKICNHPHLYSGGPKIFAGESEDMIAPEERYGYWNKAGKMIVVEALLKMWWRQEHRVLIFTQSRQMLLIMENFVRQKGYSYLKLDGGTSIAARQPLINKFNEDKSYFLMLLTTRVGGLGVNLTGANRIVIYDPDWNPATDTQARERAWRIGQKNSVTVYRLITAGTIEEKMYHRQIFKQFLCNKVLKDPRQRRFFKSNDLLELFTLKETDNDSTETAAIFAGTGSQVRVHQRESKPKSIKTNDVTKVQKRVKSSSPKSKTSPTDCKIHFSQEKVEHMKKLAHELSLKVAQKTVGNTSVQSDSASGASNDKVQTSSFTASEICTKSFPPTEDVHENTFIITDTNKEQSSDDELENMKQLAMELTQELSDKVKIAAAVNCEVSACTSNASKKSKTSSSPSKDISNHVDTDIQSSENINVEIPIPLKVSEEKNTSIINKTENEGNQSLRRSHNFKSSVPVPENSKHKRQKKHKKHKKRKWNSDIEFEGEKVPNLVGTSSISSKAQDGMKEEAAHSAKQDDYVLRKLFAKTGLQTAMQHDKVMESGHADFAIVEGEARRVAEDAVKAMKASRRHCWNAMAGIPTWTGTSGSLRSEENNAAHLQKSRPKFGSKKKTSSLLNKGALKDDDKPGEDSGSNALLARIRARNMLLTETDQAGPSTTVPNDHKDLLDDIRTFVAFGASVDGRATTDEIIAQFRDRLPPQSSALFKQMLMQICEFHRLPSDQGVWKLIPEFNW